MPHLFQVDHALAQVVAVALDECHHLRRVGLQLLQRLLRRLHRPGGTGVAKKKTDRYNQNKG